ncbi:MAG: hypothetical protein FWD99_04330 [Oscillospiraceae bacterium]|nr:hypothetical protein [Oscillospiraceae bacterium]
MEETLQQILFELKELKKSQAVVEQTAKKTRSDTFNLHIAHVAAEKNQAVLEQGMTRINERLDGMQTDMADMRTDIANMQTDIAGLRTDMTGVQTDITDIQADLARVAVTQENDVLPKIQLFCEGQSELVAGLNKLKDVPAQIEDIQNTVSVLKYAVKAHTHD